MEELLGLISGVESKALGEGKIKLGKQASQPIYQRIGISRRRSETLEIISA